MKHFIYLHEEKKRYLKSKKFFFVNSFHFHSILFVRLFCYSLEGHSLKETSLKYE